MKVGDTMTAQNVIRWTPRILSILLIIMLFALSLDVFDGESGWMNIVIGLLIHNIPPFILLIVLIIAWKKPIVGAIVWTLTGILYSVFMLFREGMFPAILTLGLPAVIIGVLFWMDDTMRKKTK